MFSQSIKVFILAHLTTHPLTKMPNSPGKRRGSMPKFQRTLKKRPTINAKGSSIQRIANGCVVALNIGAEQ